jgi:uncharacterized protein with HEPN domain
MSRDSGLLLSDIIDSIEKIRKYVEGYAFEDFINDSRTLDAVIRNFEIIGEASGRLPEEFRERFSSVHWARIRGFRNRIVHDYMGIDYEIVWNIIENDLAELQKEIMNARDSLTDSG